MKELDLSEVIDAEIVDDTPSQIPDGFWWCGKCRSFLPRNYWHNCDNTSTRSGPHDRI